MTEVVPPRGTLEAEILQAWPASTTLDEALQRCAEAIVAHADAAFARIWVNPPGSDVLVLRASAGMYTHLDGDHATIPIGAYKIGLIAQERQPHLTNDVLTDPRISDPEWARREGMVSFAGYPMLADDRLVGVVGLFARHPLDESLLTMLAGLTDALAVLVDGELATEQRLDLMTRLSRQTDLLQAVMQQLPSGLVMAFPDRDEIVQNKMFADLGERGLDTSVALGTDHQPGLLRQVLDGRDPVVGQELTFPSQRGGFSYMRVSAVPVLDRAGEVIAAVMTVDDISARRRAEQRASAQAAVARVLAQESDVESVRQRVLSEVGESIGWTAGEWWAVNRAAGRLFRAALWPETDGAEIDLTFGPNDGLPGQVWRTGNGQWIADVAEDPDFARPEIARERGLRSAVAVPIAHGAGVFGILVFFYEQVVDIDHDLLETLKSVGRQAGMFEARRQAERLADAGRANVAAMLSSAIDAVIAIDHEGAITSFNPAAEAIFGHRADDVIGRPMADTIIPVEMREPHRAGLQRYLDTGEARVLGQLIELPALRADGTTFTAEVAITQIHTTGPPAFTAYLRDITDRKTAEAQLIAERERLAQISQTLQRSLLPPSLPKIAGVSLGESFLPAGDGHEVGGDFYDVNSLSPGRWDLVVGDVCGKGHEAAALTALVRYTLRAAGVEGRSPVEVMSVANEVILREDTYRFCTVALARLESADAEGARLRLVLGGHPQPLVLRAGGDVEAVGEAGTVLGVRSASDASWSDTGVFLEPGDSLIMFTDGVLEARGADRDLFGEARLSRTLATLAGQPASHVAEGIGSEVLAFQQGLLADDVAVLVIQAARP